MYVHVRVWGCVFCGKHMQVKNSLMFVIMNMPLVSMIAFPWYSTL